MHSNKVAFSSFVVLIVFVLVSAVTIDVFVSEISSSGSHLVFSTYLGGDGFDIGDAIAIDALGNIFVTGITGSLNFPVKNAFQKAFAGGSSDAFVTKLNSSGRMVYSTYLGGGGASGDQGMAITASPSGQAVVAGFTDSRNFPTTTTAFKRALEGTADGFLTKLDPLGKLGYSSYLGGASALGVALDRDTNAYIAGGATSAFPVTPGAFQQTPGGLIDAFVAKVVPLCALSKMNRSVTICSPSSGSTVRSPVRIIAGTTDVTPVKLTQVYLDGKKIYEARLSAINVGLPIAAGTHRLTVQALDTASVFFKKSITVTVR